MIRALVAATLVALAAAGASACGQKGPLKLPEAAPPKAAESK